MNLQELDQLQNAYIDGLIKFSRSQKKFWRKVPYLALKCQGRGGYSDQYSYAIRHGFWRVGSAYSVGYSYRVDCETGNICDWIPGDELKPSKRSFHMLSIRIPDLNAEVICEQLINDAQRPFSSIFRTEQGIEAEQQELADKYGITPIYKRK